MTHEYMTNGRVALDLNRMLSRYGMSYLPVCGSTQEQAKAILDRGGKAPVVVVAEQQTAGRGRLDRTWIAPEYSSILMSVGLSQSGHHSAFTVKAGVVVAEALRSRGVPVQLKWPNDIVAIVDGRVRKLGGILAEVHRDHVVVGIGINISMDASELPTPDAISCRQLGTTPRREHLIDDIVDGLVALPQGATLEQYRSLSATIGAEIEVAQIAGDAIVGRALDVDADGALIVIDAAGLEHRITVGDVQHLRGVR